MKSREASYKFVGFFDLVCDASFAYFRSKECEDHYEQNRYARASILAAALCVESFANCAMDTLALPKRTSSELDRLPTLGKLDIYLKFSGLQLLDRTKSEVQRVNELIRSRNDFVHVKTSRIKADVAPARLKSADVPRWDFRLSPESHPNLDIYKEPLAWGAGDAHKALSAVSEFLRHVLSRLDEAKASTIRASLISAIEVDDVSVPLVLPTYKQELERLQTAGLDFSVLLEDHHPS